jgi:signal transduction histidine kinase
VDAIALRYAGAEVGALELAARPRSAGERRRLDRLARQASVAVHSVVLAREARRARQQVVVAREEERRSLRRDLHDEIGPVIAALALQAETARDLVAADPGAATALLDRLVPRLNGAVREVRALVHELRPPTLDELGLAGAVRELAARFQGPGRTVCAEADEVGDLPAAVELAAYRISAEALSNAVRHGDPTTVTVRLVVDDAALLIAVSDDGAGVAAGATPGLGLASMRERAEELGGTCSVEPGAGGGTTVTVRLPREPAAEARLEEAPA